jgi:hypothetical protein
MAVKIDAPLMKVSVKLNLFQFAPVGDEEGYGLGDLTYRFDIDCLVKTVRTEAFRAVNQGRCVRIKTVKTAVRRSRYGYFT